jgi:hypothetical protein
MTVDDGWFPNDIAEEIRNICSVIRQPIPLRNAARSAVTAKVRRVDMPVVEQEIEEPGSILPAS